MHGSQRSSSINQELHSNATVSYDDFKLKADVLSLDESASALDLSEDEAKDAIKIENQ